MTIALLVSSFIAGMFSILAPCVITLLPVMMARGADGRRPRSPVYVIAGLAGSIVLFSILLKSTTLLLGVPQGVWTALSGGIVLVFGITMIFPGLWERLALTLRLPVAAQQNLARVSGRRGRVADVVLGASLGPVFSACSPTYALIVASILPATPLVGLTYLLAYVAGLALLMGVVIRFGRSVLVRLSWGIDPHSMFHKIMGVVLVLIGLMILTGFDKVIISYLVSHGLFDWQVNLESSIQGTE